MNNTDLYVQKYSEYLSMGREDKLDTPEATALADEMDDLWKTFCPTDIDKVESGLTRCMIVDRIARYIEIWDQLREVPVNERPAELREEFDDIWRHFTPAEMLRLDKAMEARG